MKHTKIPSSVKAIRQQLGWTPQQLVDAVGVTRQVEPDNYKLQRIIRIIPYLKMYRSNPDWNL